MAKPPTRFDKGSGSSQPPAASAEAPLRFEAAYRRLHDDAVSFAEYYVGDWADDVVQDGFLALWNCLYAKGQIPESDTEVDTVFYQILRRRMLNRMRDEDRLLEKHDDPRQVLDLTSRLERQGDTLAAAEASMLEKRIQYLIAALPPRTREVYELSLQPGGEPKAIAAKLGMPLGTTRWHIYEAERQILTTLTSEGHMEGNSRSRVRE